MKTEKRHFDCPAVEHPVMLTIASIEHRSDKTEQEDLRREEVSNCNAAKECGVKTDTGEYQWNKCVHPNRPKTG